MGEQSQNQFLDNFFNVLIIGPYFTFFTFKAWMEKSDICENIKDFIILIIIHIYKCNMCVLCVCVCVRVCFRLVTGTSSVGWGCAVRSVYG